MNLLESVQRLMAKNRKTRKRNIQIYRDSINCQSSRKQETRFSLCIKLGLHKKVFILTLSNKIPKISLNHSILLRFFFICLFAQI